MKERKKERKRERKNIERERRKNDHFQEKRMQVKTR